MIFIKKMCVLRQMRPGFSGDGKQVGGVVKAEQYGKSLSVEVSVVGFAPLAAGEYYAIIADSYDRVELLPLRGKSLFNLISELDVSEGFCAVICLVKNGITPLAYGVSGNRQYDFEKLIRSVPAAFDKGDFRIAVTQAFPEGERLRETTDETQRTLDDLSWVVCHQANSRIIDHCVKALHADGAKFYKNMDRHGNTSAASIPVALNELAESGQLHPGQILACIGFGGGLTWGGMIVEYKG